MEETKLDDTEKKSTFASGLASWVKTILYAMLLALVITKVFIINTFVMSGSMETTIMTGDRIISNRLAYIASEPQRFDIVIFEYPFQEPAVHYVKRIIALPGETVEIIGGKVYIDGAAAPLRDEFIREIPEGDYGPYTVPEDSYFFLGDNRSDSVDSRFWPSPYVHRDKIVAKAMFVYYPRIAAIKSK